MTENEKIVKLIKDGLKKEVIEFIKENLSLTTKEHMSYYEVRTFTIKLMLCDEVISETDIDV